MSAADRTIDPVWCRRCGAGPFHTVIAGQDHHKLAHPRPERRVFEGRLMHRLTPFELSVGGADLCGPLDELQGRTVRFTIEELV